MSCIHIFCDSAKKFVAAFEPEKSLKQDEKTCACVVTYEILGRQIRVTDGKAAPLLRCPRADVSATDFRR